MRSFRMAVAVGALSMMSMVPGATLVAQSPYGQSPWGVPNSGFGPWGRVQIRTPFWSLNVDPNQGTDFQGAYGSYRAAVPVPPYPPMPPFGPWGRFPSPFAGRFAPAYVENGVIVSRPVMPRLPESGQPGTGSADPYGRDNVNPQGSPQESLSTALDRLALSAEQLRIALERHPQGESWMKFLDPTAVRDFATRAARDESALDDEPTLRQLREVSGHYQATFNSTEFGWVLQLPGFRETAQRLDNLFATEEPSEPRNDPQSIRRDPPPPPMPPQASPSPTPAPLVPTPASPPPAKHPESRLEELPAPGPTTAKRGSF